VASVTEWQLAVDKVKFSVQ